MAKEYSFSITKPISPKDIINLKEKLIPSDVIDSFNELIAKHFNGNHANFGISEAISLIKSKMGVQTIENNWLAVEDIYRKVGWVVEFDRAGFCEGYESNYTFSLKDKNELYED